MNEYIKAFKRWWLEPHVLPVHVLVSYIGGMSVFFPQKSTAPTLVQPLGVIMLILWIFVMPWALMMDEKNRILHRKVREADA